MKVKFKVTAVNTPEEIGEDVLRAHFTRSWRAAWSHCFVLRAEDDEAGLILFDFYPDSLLGSVQMVFVLDQFRRRGAGRNLMREALTKLERLGAQTVWLEPFALDRRAGQPNADALRRWYAGIGFADAAGAKMEKILCR
ncbi:GNAT family N-acetyltransferase [Burkholderia gladioli]|uniref:GNAT family N-acetyltransferase n=1 Tax=Burkholderia gladioli TaxID=28095 RepID=UPI00163ECA32|nr:GNAT family N-acetyltransferase [Burkholderia gladioli]